MQWHRISPLSVLFIITVLVQKVGFQALPGLIVMFAALSSTDVVEQDWIFRILTFLVAMAVGFSILVYLRFRYRVTDERILLRRGVLHREELDIEFGRVQNITIKEPFYMRPFGLAVLSIDTAGSQAQEIMLAGIDKSLAQSLRETILAGARPDVETAAGLTAGEAEPNLLLELSRRDILVYGLTSNFMLWVAVALGAVFGAGDVSERLIGWLESRLQLEQVVAVVLNEGGTILLTLLILVLALLALLLLPLISVIGALLRYDGYRLTADGETYRKSSGLLTRHDESLKQHKIQALVWKQNAIARFFGRINLQLRQASAGSGVDQGQLPTGAKSTFLVPALHPPQASDLSAEFLPGCTPDEAEFSTVDRRRFMVFNLVVPLISMSLLTLIPTLLFDWRFALLLPLMAAILLWVVDKRWQKLGYGVVGDYGFFRSGLVGSLTTIFPLFKIQRVDIRQTPLQHRKGLAHMTIHLASHSMKIPYVSTRDAYRFRDLALYYAESTDRPWY